METSREGRVESGEEDRVWGAEKESRKEEREKKEESGRKRWVAGSEAAHCHL